MVKKTPKTEYEKLKDEFEKWNKTKNKLTPKKIFVQKGDMRHYIREHPVGYLALNIQKALKGNRPYDEDLKKQLLEWANKAYDMAVGKKNPRNNPFTVTTGVDPKTKRRSTKKQIYGHHNSPAYFTGRKLEGVDMTHLDAAPPQWSSDKPDTSKNPLWQAFFIEKRDGLGTPARLFDKGIFPIIRDNVKLVRKQVKKSWMDVLKRIYPSEFLAEVQERYGGELRTGRYRKGGTEKHLIFDNGDKISLITSTSRYMQGHRIMFNQGGVHSSLITEGEDLDRLLRKTLEYLEGKI